MLQSSDQDFNSKKHSSYFQQSGAPVNAAPYTDKVMVNRRMSAKAGPVNYQAPKKGPSPSKKMLIPAGGLQRATTHNTVQD